MKQRQYYSVNINDLQISSLKPLQFTTKLRRENVPFYRGILGRLLTVESKFPTNTLDDATSWLESFAKKAKTLEEAQQQIVPYIDSTSMRKIDMTDEQAKQLRKTYLQTHHKG